jgi:hypothetical protein
MLPLSREATCQQLRPTQVGRGCPPMSIKGHVVRKNQQMPNREEEEEERRQLNQASSLCPWSLPAAFPVGCGPSLLGGAVVSPGSTLPKVTTTVSSYPHQAVAFHRRIRKGHLLTYPPYPERSHT